MSTKMKRAFKDAAEQTSAAMDKEIEEYEFLEVTDDQQRYVSLVDTKTMFSKLYRRISRLEAEVTAHTAQHAQWEAKDMDWEEKAQKEVNTEAGLPKPQPMPVESSKLLSDERTVFPETFRPPLADALHTETPKAEAEDLPRYYSTGIYSNGKLLTPDRNGPQLVDLILHEKPCRLPNNNSDERRNVINDTDKPRYSLDEEDELEDVDDTINPLRPIDVKYVLRLSINNSDIFENVRNTLLFLGVAWLVLVGLHAHIKFFGLAMFLFCQWLSS